jgi:hypothetical protein
MRVILREDLLSAAAIRHSPFFLPSLFAACQRHGHALVPEFEPASSPAYIAWRASRSALERDEIDAALRQSLNFEARETTNCEVIADLGTDWHATPPCVGPDDLVTLLEAPLTILVEHEINDGAFLQAVAIGLEGDDFRKCIQSRRIRFDHAGGSSMSSLIAERGHDRARAHRLWVVFDSDALTPNAPSAEALRKIAAARSASIGHHMLLRRAIENYLPPDVLDHATPLSPRHRPRRIAVGAFRRLKPDPRAHFGMKAGFDGDAARLASGGMDEARRPEVDQLFSGVNEADRLALAAGFGNEISALFVPAPDLGRPSISEAARRKDGQEAEMVPLFRAILRWL